jgi:two-component system, response regulator PdtaR
MTANPPLILVAEDNPLASLALRAQLEALHYRVIGPAHDGDEAVALGACFPADIALFDFRMPRRNGLEAARALFDIAPTPVVLLSGLDATSLPEPMPRPPIFASLAKPADLNDLRTALDAAADAFRRWIEAQPERRDLVQRRRHDREAIARTVTSLAGDGPPGGVAIRLLEQAGREHRPLLDVARDALPTGA